MSLTDRGLVAGAEAVLLDDFMTYVEDNFASLGPFRKLALCRGDRGRINRRLRQLLADVAEADAYPSDYGSYVELESAVVDRAYLRLNDPGDGVELSASPADTLTKARAFYPDSKTVKLFRALADSDGWEGSPHFHFGFHSRGFCWTRGEIERNQYIDLWRQRIADGERAVRREDWDQYWDELVELGVIDPDDRTKFDQEFTQTNRNSATPRPGLVIRRGWPLAEAERLDSDDRLAREVDAALRALLEALQASVVAAAIDL